MARPGDFYNAVYSTAIGLGANDVQARLAAAQASEETGYGKSMVGNNLFGIKAGSDYTGASVTAGTNEEYNGVMQREQANFRAYDDFTQSVSDYLGVIESNFPDAWSADTFSEAVKGLNSGVYGKYATNSAYGKNLAKIDSKYGGTAYAEDPQNVPTPYGPNDNPTLAALPDDVTAFPDQPATPVDPEFAYAANPSNVPVPTVTSPGLLSAYADETTTGGPFSAVLGQPSSWGLNKDVAPAPLPSSETWSDMASAKPVQAPMDSVTANADLGVSPGLFASAVANPTPASNVASRPAPVTQADVNRAFFNPTGANEFDPSFTAGLLGPSNPVVPTAVETTSYTPPQTVDIASSRFSTPAKTSRIGALPGLTDTARMDPLAGAIDPVTNTTSFMDQPAQPANIAGFSDAYAAQRGPTTGLLSANAQTVQGLAEKQLAEIEAQKAQQVSVPSTGLLSGNQALAANATVPSLATAYTAPTTVTPAEQAIADQMNAVATPEQQAAGYAEAAKSMAKAGMLNIGQQPPTNLSGELPTNFDVLGTTTAPALETVEVADQPAVATVEGPATTPAVEQQQDKAITASVPKDTTAAAPTESLGSKISKSINKGSITGSVLGSIAGGPIGGVLGGLLGNAVNQNGGLSGLFGSGFSAPKTQIAGGMSNIAGLYGGAFAPGTYAVASNGATITAQPGGYTTYTNPYGVTESIGPDGKISGYFGSKPTAPTDPDADTEAA